jgi:integration host factor subunit beta
MIKSQLVQRLVLQNPHLYQRDIEKLVETILGEIVMALAATGLSCAISARFL